jgi:hypothetical protein
MRLMWLSAAQHPATVSDPSPAAAKRGMTARPIEDNTA